MLAFPLGQRWTFSLLERCWDRFLLSAKPD